MQAVVFSGKEHPGVRVLSSPQIERAGFRSFDVGEAHLLPNTSDDFSVSCCLFALPGEHPIPCLYLKIHKMFFISQAKCELGSISLKKEDCEFFL